MIVDVLMTSQTKPHLFYMLRNAIHTLRESESGIDFNVIVIESLMHTEAGQNETILYTETPYNCHRAVKSALHLLQNEWVAICNNDLIFYKFWLSEILAAHRARPDIVSFSPWNELRQWHPTCFPERQHINVGYRTGYEFCGWCIVIRRDVLLSMEMDERCDFWFSDNIFVDELRAKGLNHALVATSRVDHIQSQTNPQSTGMAKLAHLKYLAGKKKAGY